MRAHRARHHDARGRGVPVAEERIVVSKARLKPTDDQAVAIRPIILADLDRKGELVSVVLTSGKMKAYSPCLRG